MQYLTEKNISANPEFSVYHAYGTYYKSLGLESELLHKLTIALFKKYQGEMTIEGRNYKVGDGDVMLFKQSEIRSGKTVEGSYEEYISICIDNPFQNLFNFDCNELFECFYNHESGVGNLIPADVVAEYKINVLMEELLKISKNGANKLLCICKIVEILIKLNEAATRRTDMIAENQTVSKVLKYITNHFTEDISCVSIAECFHISRFRLEHLFKACVGVSMWDYVILRRLIYFDELVQEGTGAKEAAQRAGFNNYSNFYRLYKKHMGITPAESKKRAKNN